MNSEKLLERKSAVFQMGLLFNQQPSDEKITAYANALINYRPEQIIYAFNQIILSGSAFFPSLAEILKHLRPESEKKEDRAPIIVAEMLQLIRSFGQYDEARMFESASEDAKLAFKHLGPTQDIRLSENIETTKAQLERLVKGVLAQKEHSGKILQLHKIGITTERKKEMQIVDYSEFTNGDPA